MKTLKYLKNGNLIEHPLYLVDKNSKIWSIKNQKYLKPQKIGGNNHDKKYHAVYIDKKFVYVHNIMIQTFWNVVPVKFKIECNHKDCNKFNNQLNNLELVDRKDNIIHARKNIVYKKQKVWTCERRWSFKIIQKDEYGNLVKEWDSTNDIIKEMGISRSTIFASLDRSYGVYKKYWFCRGQKTLKIKNN